jgi:hypothetical protein
LARSSRPPTGEIYAIFTYSQAEIVYTNLDLLKDHRIDPPKEPVPPAGSFPLGWRSPLPNQPGRQRLKKKADSAEPAFPNSSLRRGSRQADAKKGRIGIKLFSLAAEEAEQGVKS